MIFAAAQAAEVNDNRDDQDHEINSRYGLSRVHHPRVCQRCQRQEQETDQGQ
jgi:hypothetical protein